MRFQQEMKSAILFIGVTPSWFEAGFFFAYNFGNFQSCDRQQISLHKVR